ncbi:MAG TPA: urea ABC transporter permease subunit UrtB [Beijerinckiaceae bacterium]|nr:urea ABC transporter permease subunit UrtB [Beijerinckiaceae bacterium]
MLVLAGPSRAAGFEEALPRFSADSYAETEAAIAEVAQSGDPRAAEVVQALADGRLLYSSERKLFIKGKSEALREVATGQAVSSPPAGLKPVRVNNRIRRAIDSAIGGLTLLAPDPGKRLEAAQSVFKARNAALLPTVRTALERETEPRIRRALMEANAALVFVSTDQPELDRLTAAGVIADRADVDAQALLRSLPTDAPERLRAAAQRGIDDIEKRQAILRTVQDVFYGISLGSVLLLAAIGLAITFGVMGIINMAHGEMVMLGAYATYVVQESIRQKAIVLGIPWTSFRVVIPLPDISLDWSLAIAVPFAFLVAGGIGVLIERCIIRFLYGRPLETLLATWGVSLILQQAVRTQFGANNREVGNPSFMSGSLEVFGIALTWSRIWIVAFSLAVFFILLLVLKFTSFGLRMRAVVQNRRMAASMGIRTNWIDALTFGLGSGIAGIAGVALSQIDNVSPNLGQGYIIDSFMVVVFGGVGNLWGTLVGALTLGVANKLLEPFAGAVLGKIMILVFIILFIQKRPRGLFALKGRAVEA